MSNEAALASNPLGSRPIRGMLWSFALPGILSQLVNALYNIVDQIFVGWGIDELGIAATTIAFPLATITTALSVLYGSGGASRFSILLGEGKPEEARRTMGNAIALMLLTGAAVAMLAFLFLEPLLYAFGATELILPYAMPYARILCLGIPFGICGTGLAFFIRADGSPRYSSAVLMAGAFFNIIFDPIFLFVLDMGIGGIALATTLGQLLVNVLALLYILRRCKNVKLKRSDLALRPRIIGAICALGAAAFTTHLLATVVQIISANTMRYYGAFSIYGSEIPIAAAGAVSKVMIVFMSCVIGISLGCQPLYGFNYGAKKYDRVKETYLLALRYGTTMAVIAFLCIQLFPRQILAIFGSDDAMFYEFATRYIRIYLFMTFANALQPITSTFFTSIGRANLGFWMAVIRQGLLLIPLLLVLPRLFGLDGMLLAGPIADGIAAVIVVLLAIRTLKRLTKMQADAADLAREKEALL